MYCRYLRSFIWIVFACFLAGCASSESASQRVAKQDQPAAQTNPAAVQVAPAAPAGGTLPEGAAPAPSAVVPVNSHDFGVVNEERDYLYDFKIKNAGSAVLQIKKVLPG